MEEAKLKKAHDAETCKNKQILHNEYNQLHVIENDKKHLIIA